MDGVLPAVLGRRRSSPVLCEPRWSKSIAPNKAVTLDLDLITGKPLAVVGGDKWSASHRYTMRCRSGAGVPSISSTLLVVPGFPN
jgi:hypothetical protein